MNGTPDKHGRGGRRRRRRERGFALLAMMSVIGVGSLGVLLAVAAFVPAPGERQARVGVNLETAQRLVAAQFLRDGAFPTRLDTVESGGGVYGDDWTRDPYGVGRALRFVKTSSGVQVRSRGPDQRANTADDMIVAIEGEALLRVRQRLRLRLVRAVHVADLESQVQAANSTTASTALPQAVRDYAIALRSWRTATSTERTALQATMDTAATVFTTLLATTGYTAPITVTGAGGLMTRLGLGDQRAFDGLGRAYQLHPVLGVIAVGYDAVGGTDDDM